MLNSGGREILSQAKAGKQVSLGYTWMTLKWPQTSRNCAVNIRSFKKLDTVLVLGTNKNQRITISKLLALLSQSLRGIKLQKASNNKVIFIFETYLHSTVVSEFRDKIVKLGQEQEKEKTGKEYLSVQCTDRKRTLLLASKLSSSSSSSTWRGGQFTEMVKNKWSPLSSFIF